MRTIRLTAVLSALVFAAGNAAAVGFGDLVVRSHLGQALHAEIRLIETPGTNRPGETCFRLGAGEGNEDLPVLTQGRLRLEQSGARSRLIITSLQTINEPVLLINVHVGCGAELVRSYTLLIDPAEPGRPETGTGDSMAEHDAGERRFVDSDNPQRPAASNTATSGEYPTTWEVVDGESAKSITRTLFPRQPRAQRRFLKALRGANPQVDFGAAGESPLAAGVSLEIPDTRRAPVARKAANEAGPSRKLKKPDVAPKPSFDGKISDRLMISGDAVAVAETGGSGDASGLGLRLSSDLSMRLSDKVSENARAMLRVEYKLLNALVFQAEKQLELAEQIRNLEARFEEMRVANEGTTRTADEVLAPSKADQPAAIEAAEQKPAVESAPQKKRAVPVDTLATEGIGWWQPILLMLILAGALAGWLMRRNRAQEVDDAMPVRLPNTDSGSSKSTPETIPPAIPAKADRWAAAEAEAAASAVPSSSRPGILHDASQPLPFREGDNLRTVSPAAAIEVSHVGETDDSSTVLELAEIMISFGRIKGAAQALAEYLENSPDVSLFPWLKLLEIYRMNDMREEFGACSARLRSHFNVAPASWEEAGECLGEKIEPLNENDLSIDEMLQKLPTVGTFPHIREGIRKTWDTSEGLAYLKHLLRDTRNGQRTGFPLSIAREILFLLDLQESILRNKV